jgi:hypothetical protein
MGAPPWNLPNYMVHMHLVLDLPTLKQSWDCYYVYVISYFRVVHLLDPQT